ncbi:MAG TPA: valine--tRNA ligase [Actinomycetes bacterium]|jgi:valyl-tRNA synthetase|nr:valine--tRNA ligase [Actinomycetes bacterium]
MTAIPEKPSLDGLEAKWDAFWQEQGTYRFDRSKGREAVYAVDTPPPTVSGSLHLGSAFGYIQTDAIARFQRMQGREVFYPMGWDDNGLPTERRVQNYYGVRCDPSIPYDPTGILPGGDSAQRPISRRNFVELCHRLTEKDEQVFERVWRTLGLSVDWTLTYATVDNRSRRIAQQAFLRNLRRGEAYAREAPTLWDVDFQTAVAQAELEERESQGALHRVTFARADGDEPVHVETTRPELLPSCVALVAHPDDDRHRPLFGAEVVTPLFGVRVPVVAHPLAEPDKGSGIAMVCTFGDTTDVVWWQELDLPLRVVMQRDGRFQHATPEWLAGNEAEAAWAELAGRSSRQARARVVELLRESGDLVGEPLPITHQVKYYEKGERPLEIVTSRQWYIRNGGRDSQVRMALLERGRALAWHPDLMRVRYEHWVEGLNSDWLISRQRFFGVPFPVWYPTGSDGEPLRDEPILCDEAALPVDPQSEPPPGYEESRRGKPGGFVGDPDVMDTWATSSLTPQIACGWEDDPDLFARTFPMDLRPQGPEIIRTWLFSTVLRSHLEHETLPWSHTFINGWVLDPDRKKMSKSRGNVVTPMPFAEEYGADGLRYWACRGGPGTDTAIDRGQMKTGRRLAVKLLNASKFVLGLSFEGGPASTVTEDVDRAMLAQLAAVVDDATASFEVYQYHRALERSETFFWHFCDDYVELVKDRSYGSGAPARSARAALSMALSTLLPLFAPFLPFVTEEVWSWWQPGSVHRAPWPRSEELRTGAGGTDPAVLDVAAEVLAEVRKAKSTEKRSLRTKVARLTVADVGDHLAALRMAEADLRAAGRVADLVLHEAPQRLVTVELAPIAEQVGSIGAGP